MNLWLSRAAWAIRGLSSGQRVLLLALADDCSASSRICAPALAELAERCELSEKHVMRLRAQLVSQGYLRCAAPGRPGQCAAYEVLPGVPAPLRPVNRPDTPVPQLDESDKSTGSVAAPDGSQPCDPLDKNQGNTPPTPPLDLSRHDPTTGNGGRGSSTPTTPASHLGHRRRNNRTSTPSTPSPAGTTLAKAAVTALRSDQQTRIDPLGLRRLERAAEPLVAGWTPADLACRIAAERMDRAENLAAVLTAILRRYALEPSPEQLRTAEQAARQATAHQPPSAPCDHGDPAGCTACPFCRRGIADPGGKHCHHCTADPPHTATA